MTNSFVVVLQDGSKDLARETWMTELPPVLQHIGLGARTFKKRAGPESKDRSLWTETPADKEKKIRVGTRRLNVLIIDTLAE